MLRHPSPSKGDRLGNAKAAFRVLGTSALQYRKTWRRRLLAAIAATFTRRRFEAIDPDGHIVATYSSEQLALEHIAGAAYHALIRAQITVTAAHVLRLRMRAPHEHASEPRVPVDSTIMYLVARDSAAA